MSTENVVDIKMSCNKCEREITDGMLFYRHPEYGFVGECCPEFDDGGIAVKDEEKDND